MKITPNDNGDKDWHGNFPICTVKGSEMAQVVDWLWRNNGQGYKFGVVLDLMNDEYPVPEKQSDFRVNIYYLDELFEEVVAYIGVDDAQEMLDKMKGG